MELMLAGRYRVGDRIGTGGTSHVYRAHDVVLDRAVAVKLLDEAAATSADPALRRRFESEARTAARFVHQNAVAIFDAGVDQGQLFLVMELVSGGTLAQHLGDSGPMPSARVATLGGQLASALGAAHAAGIIHRDVKPSNVLLDHHGNAKLADFGIARRFDEIEDSLTSTGMVMGTRHYVSPEQAYGQPLGPATDIFSLGVTLYEAATGERPPSAIDRALDQRLDVRAIDPSIDARLADVIARATAIPVEGRFADARQMGVMLAAVASSGAPGPPATPTAVMPIGAADVSTANAPTTVARSTAITPPGAPMPLMGDRLLDEHRQRQRLLRTGSTIVVLVLVAGALAFAVSTALSNDDGDLSAASTTAPTAAVTTVAPTVATTLPTTTLAPTTLPPTTASPTTVIPTVSVPQELIPGFAVPVDAEDFLRILEAYPELAGERGEDLAEGFERLLEGPPGKWGERREELRDDIQRWSDDGELDPIIAAVAIHYIGELEEPDERDEPD
jgi:eukaryotic-like serine/threonine-protein kinase